MAKANITRDIIHRQIKVCVSQAFACVVWQADGESVFTLDWEMLMVLPLLLKRSLLLTY